MKLLGAAVAWVVLLVAVLAAGCGQDSREEQGTATTENPSTVPRTQESQEMTSELTLTPAGDDEIGSAEATEAPFTVAPEMSGGSKGAADSIRGVKLVEHEDYERAVIDFGSGGEPASRVPSWSLSSPTGEGYARITFPSVAATAVSDGTLDGSILNNFYVVRAPGGGGMFVDIFATGAFQYRVTEFSDPGRLVVDYHPASVALGFPIPAQSQKTVLFEPRQGEAITSPLRVSGYSRNFEASNSITLRDSSGNALSRRTVLSNDWLDTWGYFEATLEFPAFEGQATLGAGAESARDGSFEGVEVEVVYDAGR